MLLCKMLKCAEVAIAVSYKSDSFAACLPFSSCFDGWIVLFNRDQDLAEPLDSEGSDTEMERGIVQVQQHSAQHRAKMWKVESVVRKTAKMMSATKKNAALFHNNAHFNYSDILSWFFSTFVNEMKQETFCTSGDDRINQRTGLMWNLCLSESFYCCIIISIIIIISLVIKF